MTIKFVPRKLPEYKAQSKEVIKELNSKPYLMVRIEITGISFPHRAPHPFIRICNDREKFIKDLMTEISPDSQKLYGYFPARLPESGRIEFGYGNEIWGQVKEEFNEKTIERLDRKKVSKEIEELI